MAERRMFAKTIIMSDAFIELPHSARSLYVAFGMMADDDGFVNNPRGIMRQIESSKDDLDLLITEEFIIPFDSGVIAVKAWKINNYIQKDRYTETKYLTEKKELTVNGKGMYTRVDTACIHPVYEVDTQVSIGKESVGKDSSGKCSVVDDTATATEENQLKVVGGSLGKGVVYLTDCQLHDLMDRFGIDVFNFYVDRLATFIIDKKAHVKNHYETILKWHEEDSKVKKSTGKKKERHGNFDVQESFENAVKRSYGGEI
jgi:hypothetical protein